MLYYSGFILLTVCSVLFKEPGITILVRYTNIILIIIIIIIEVE